MRLFNITAVAALGLFVAACGTVKVTPAPIQVKSADMSKSSLAGLVPDLEKATKGRYAVYLKATDWDKKASEGRQLCPYTKLEISLNNAYRETAKSGYTRSFENVVFVDAPLSAEKMKAGEFNALFVVDSPRIGMVLGANREKFLTQKFYFSTYIRGSVIARGRTGRIDQMEIETTEKVEAETDQGCRVATKIGSESTGKAILGFTVEMVSASKALLNNINQ